MELNNHQLQNHATLTSKLKKNHAGMIIAPVSMENQKQNLVHGRQFQVKVKVKKVKKVNNLKRKLSAQSTLR
jgi:hypothetical protein